MDFAIVAGIYLLLASTSKFVFSEEVPGNASPALFHPIFQRQPLITAVELADITDYRRFKRLIEDSNQEMATVKTAVQRFQTFLLDCKGQCAAKMGFAPNEIKKSLLYEENPTPKEKCLMACVLERTQIMDANYKVSLNIISRLAGLISNHNELIMAIARATADNCNRHINTRNKCEAAAQINRCLAQGLKAHKIQIIY